MMIQLTLHHLGSLIAGALLIASADVAVFKMVYTGLTAWTWEWPMFVCFLVVRTYDACAQDKDTIIYHAFESFYRPFVLYGMPMMIVIYFATRVIEVVFMAMIIVGVFDRHAATPTVIGVIMIMAIAVTLQFYSGYILVVFSLRRRNWMASMDNDRNTPKKDTVQLDLDASDCRDVVTDDDSAPSRHALQFRFDATDNRRSSSASTFVRSNNILTAPESRNEESHGFTITSVDNAAAAIEEDDDNNNSICAGGA
jgi:hypothetical protein